jgi:hypothetical protein
MRATAVGAAVPGPPPLGAMPWLDRSFRWWSLLPAGLLFAALTVYPIANLVWMSLSTVEFAQGKAVWTLTPWRNLDLLLSERLARAGTPPGVRHGLVLRALYFCSHFVIAG